MSGIFGDGVGDSSDHDDGIPVVVVACGVIVVVVVVMVGSVVVVMEVAVVETEVGWCKVWIGLALLLYWGRGEAIGEGGD